MKIISKLSGYSSEGTGFNMCRKKGLIGLLKNLLYIFYDKDNKDNNYTIDIQIK